MHVYLAITTLLALLTYVYMSMAVGGARGKYKIEAPAVTGNPDFERAYRVQMNTLEWMPVFLVSLWLFALAWGAGQTSATADLIASAIGLVWIVGRILYMTGYTKAASSRSMGFMIQMLAMAVLLFGALGKLIWMAIQHQV
jgi:glutathione S-transferase